MKLNRKLILILSLVLSLALATGGTLAYLQDTDADVNVMTLGSVYIEQHEMQRAEGVAHNAGEAGAGNGVEEGSLVPFKQGQPLYPAVPSDDTAYTAESTDLFYWGDYVYSGTAGNGLWNDEKLSGALDKMVFVENTGKSDAYIRTIIAFECPEGMDIGDVNQGSHIGLNINNLWEEEVIGFVVIDGTRYEIREYSYTVNNGILAPGNTAHPSLLQVVMSHECTNEHMELLGDTYEILVVSQAVQTAGFADAETALDAAFGDTTVDNHPWLGDVIGLPVLMQDGTNGSFLTEDEYAAMMAKFAQSSTILAEANVELLLSVPSDANVIDANNTTVVLNGDGAESGRYGYLAFIPEKGEDVTVSNLNVTGAGFVELGHYGIGGGTYVANNIVIEGLAATLSTPNKGFYVGCAFVAYGKENTLNDCVMTGTTALKENTIPVDLGCVNSTTTIVNDGEYGAIYCWEHATVVIDGAEVDTIYVSPIKGTVTIKAGTHVDSIVIDYGTYPQYGTDTYLAKLIIEDGAEIGTITFDGVTYTQAEWLNR